MTTDLTPARNGADPDAPASIWHTTALTRPAPVPVPDEADHAAAIEAAIEAHPGIRVLDWIVAAATWLFALAILGGLIRAATGSDPYRGGLSVLTVALVAALLYGGAEAAITRICARIEADATDGPDGGR